MDNNNDGDALQSAKGILNDYARRAIRGEPENPVVRRNFEMVRRYHEINRLTELIPEERTPLTAAELAEMGQETGPDDPAP